MLFEFRTNRCCPFTAAILIDCQQILSFFFTLRLLQLLLIFFVVVYSSFFLARGSKTRMGWQGILIAESSHVAHKCVDGDEMLVLGRD